MATYEELYNLQNNNELLQKVAVACVIAAETIRGEDAGVTNHANRLIWAKKAFEAPRTVARGMLWAILAANKTAAPSAITGASDTTIQTAVDDAVDVFADGT